MSKKNNGSNQTPAKNTGKEKDKVATLETKAPAFSHGPVASLDLERTRKELEKNRIEFKVEKGELFTVDNGDTNLRNAAIKLVNGYKRKAG